MFLRNSSFNVSKECIDHVRFQENEFGIVDKMLDIREHHGVMQILISWQGFKDEIPDWKPLDNMLEDVPTLTRQFLKNLMFDGTAKQKKLEAKFLN